MVGVFYSEYNYSGFTENLPKAISARISAIGKPTTRMVPIVVSIIIPFYFFIVIAQ